MLTRIGRLAEIAHSETRARHPHGYSKQQLINVSREVFGGFGADSLRAPKTAQEVEQKRNAMAFVDGNYPLSMSDCFVVGISGGCGRECPVFKDRRCPDQVEMEQSC
jgi:hypothetical protein